MNGLPRLFEALERHRELVFSAEDFLWKHPETGYREWKSSEYLAREYKKLGYSLHMAGDIPGFFADIDTERGGPRLLIFSELDSLICREHPDADPETGAVHACGHCAQGAAMLGIAAALADFRLDRGLDGLCGSVRLCVVPAEELIETGYRETLRQNGIIRYFGGKIEFLRRGYLDGCGLCFMVHTGGGESGSFSVSRGGNGCVVKNISFIGKASHAGGSPQNGINALYAANLGLNAINALRETFVDGEHIRVHPIVTYGGAAVNAIPSRIDLESYVRGSTVNAIRRVNKKVNRALAASAAAIGANVRLDDRPGYSPLYNDPTLIEVSRGAFSEVAKPELVHIDDYWDTGCTDMGDISSIIPSVHFSGSGAEGMGHGCDYRIRDVDAACMTSAKFQLALLYRLLSDDAALARRVVDEFKPVYKSAADYFSAIDLFFREGEAVTYESDGSVVLRT